MSATINTTRLFEPFINTLVGVIDSEFQPFTFPEGGRWENSGFEQKENSYLLELEVPGFSKKTLAITVNQDNLRVKGKVKRNAATHMKGIPRFCSLVKVFLPLVYFNN